MYKLEELNNSKVSELKDIAKKLEIKNYDKLKKLDLAYAILDHQAEHIILHKQIMKVKIKKLQNQYQKQIIIHPKSITKLISKRKKR